MRAITVACSLTLTLALTNQGPAAGPDELILAEDGKALLPIVISENASEGTKSVAAELAQYLGKITASEFSVTPGDGTEGVVLGTIEQFPMPGQPDIAKALEIRNVFDGKEAFVVRTEPKRLLLLGATELGASHAAFRFLEDLGCRWFFPAKEWEVVPSTARLRVSLKLDDRPAILGRRIWYQWGFFERNLGRCYADYAAWARHNRMASSLKVHCGHAWQSIIAGRKQVFEEHPEYLALRITKNKETGEVEKEERGGTKFCISNPGVVEVCKKYGLDYFSKNPNADMVSMDPSDGGGHCQCDKCAKMGTVSDRVFYLANEVAKAVNEKYPGKMVGSYAYNVHSEPPSFKLEPNVYIQLTAGFIRGRWNYTELLDLWPKKCPNMGFYEYFSVYQWNRDMLPGGAGANVPHIRKKIPMLAGRKATSIDAESGNNWGLHGRGYYVANRLMWNPKIDVDTILADFYGKAFGPGAGAMKRYYERLDPGNEPLMGETLIGLAFRDVAEATRLAARRPDVLARLDHIKIYLRYFHLRWMLNGVKGKDEDATAKKKELVAEIFTHVYRTRYTYMNHWEAIRQFWTRRAAKTFEEPTWSMSGKDAPWIGKPPYSEKEIGAFFKEGLAYFEPQDVVEKEFSQDLVPVWFGKGKPRVNGDRGQWQGGLRHALYSIEGEPLVVTIIPGTIAWYRDRADATYKFKNAKEKVISEGRLTLDGKKHEITIKVPAPGLYYLDFNDSSAGWRILAGSDLPLTIPLRRGRAFLHHGWNDDMYFYVPKGTRSVQYYWKGGAHRVHGSDGKVLKKVTESGKFITVPVPEGMDGKLWRFSQIAFGHIWFFNIPNFVARSPNALMVPCEVIEKDGLVLRETTEEEKEEVAPEDG